MPFPAQTKAEWHLSKSKACSLGCSPAVSPRGSLLPCSFSGARVAFGGLAAARRAVHSAVGEGGKPSTREDDLENAIAGTWQVTSSVNLLLALVRELESNMLTGGLR